MILGVADPRNVHLPTQVSYDHLLTYVESLRKIAALCDGPQAFVRFPKEVCNEFHQGFYSGGDGGISRAAIERYITNCENLSPSSESPLDFNTVRSALEKLVNLQPFIEDIAEISSMTFSSVSIEPEFRIDNMSPTVETAFLQWIIILGFCSAHSLLHYSNYIIVPSAFSLCPIEVSVSTVVSEIDPSSLFEALPKPFSTSFKLVKPFQLEKLISEINPPLNNKTVAFVGGRKDYARRIEQRAHSLGCQIDVIFLPASYDETRTKPETLSKLAGADLVILIATECKHTDFDHVGQLEHFRPANSGNEEVLWRLILQFFSARGA